MRRMAPLLLVLELVALDSSRLAAQATSGPPNPKDGTSQALIGHVRSAEGWIQALIRNGLARSMTFARLVDMLNESDVIAYVEWRVTPEGVNALLLHQIVVQQDHRYVRIGIGRRGGDDRLIAIIAHELQHALEIAHALEVGRTIRIEEFFARIDEGGCTAPSRAGSCYETGAALDVQRAVAQELMADARRR
jgi:hypothetical protein